MRRALPAAFAAAVLAACAGGGDATPLARATPLEAWASAVCAAEQAYQDTVASQATSIDLSGLSAADRLALGVKTAQVLAPAATDAAAAIERATAPAGVETYSAALAHQLRAIGETMARQVATATASDFDPQALSAELNAVFFDEESAVRAAAATLSPAAVEALRAQRHCGNVVR